MLLNWYTTLLAVEKVKKPNFSPKFQRRDHICPNILLHTVGSSFFKGLQTVAQQAF